MPGYNNGEIPYSRCPIGLQHVARKALSQCHKGCSLRLSHGYQISNCKWSRNGLRKPAHSQGMLLNVNEENTVDNIYMDELDMRDKLDMLDEVTTRPAPSEE